MKLVYGVGVNDYDGMISDKVNGKYITKIFYRKWSDMLKRCYDQNYKIENQLTQIA